MHIADERLQCGLSSNNETEAGYKLDILSDKAAYQIIDTAWVCPVNQVLLT
jgi:hypothetical protein